MSYCEDCANNGCCENIETNEPIFNFPELGIEMTDERRAQDLIYSPREGGMVNFIPFNPFYTVKDNIDVAKEFNKITKGDYEPLISATEEEMLKQNCVAVINNNITVILNTSMWAFMMEYMWTDILDKAYELFYRMTHSIFSRVESYVYDVTRGNVENAVGYAQAKMTDLLIDISVFCSGLILDCVNRGCVNIRKANEYVDKRYNEITAKYNKGIRHRDIDKSYDECDPSFFIAMAESNANFDIKKIEEIIEINIINLLSRLNGKYIPVK